MTPTIDIPPTPQKNGHTNGNGKKIKVLMYHRIFDPADGSADDRKTCIPPAVFRSHLRTIERLGFTPVTFEDYALYLDGRLNLPKKPILITFDDGYVDTLHTALPILREFGMKAVVFVLADPAMKTNSWDAGKGITQAPLMTAEQIIELHAAGIEIGSHSLTHPHLTELTKERAWEEISRSRVLLEILLNAPVRVFAYPYGDLNAEVRHLVGEAGYRFGCGVYTGPPSIGDDHFDIRRITPTGTFDPVAFALQLVMPFEHVLWAGRNLKRIIRRSPRVPVTTSTGEEGR